MMSIITVSSRPIAAPLMVVLILVLLIFSNLLPCFLSSSSFTVTHIPGFPNALPFRLETGYVTVNEESGGELFYYFVESERNPGEDPLILWLLGGPGCSAINGLALDMGPIRFNVDDFDGRLPTLVVNPHAWTKVANMIFVDWPYGTGYSYSKNNKEEYVTDDMRTVKLIYKFLRKWFYDHPTFLSNTFYMGGDSYGAKMAVHMAYDIVEANEAGHVPLINIKGYVVGNAVTGEKIDTSTQALHAYGLGVISKELYEVW
ncbi:Serine carboxypeptidase-like 19 [Apostasia shenzhenica]|uniref:Serine carboxypeptidase-like 19 n=1 Tax=Apostasia shenzhenica TaxID=1088818 RepID=A0A2I0BFC5_9ASPA|nr:Serine carboxypeptidase-like 19 [Apostasia shenzhenica]